jgi:signal peptidase II
MLAIATVVITLDQTAKALVIANLSPGVSTPFLGDVVRLYLVYNDSAAFSIGFGVTFVFTLISSAATLVLIWLSRRLESKSWAITAGVLLGGIDGNLIDRLIRAPGFGWGHVVDFIQIPFNFAIFNLADMAIVCAAAITVIRVIRGDRLGKA